MKLKLDIRVRVAIGVSRWQVLTLLQSHHDSTLQAGCLMHSIGKVMNTPSLKASSTQISSKSAVAVVSLSACRMISQAAMTKTKASAKHC